ncbi:MAG: tRNA guanosine(34) transglycosylase Tgt [Planctomycetota bacterium]
MTTESPLRFELQANDPACAARAGRLNSPHGETLTPVFMPVGTHGALKALTPRQVEETGATIVLANTYHLAIRPGEGLVEKSGGLHGFMRWPKTILTDSGGFQVFSLPGTKIDDHGVQFRYEKDGEPVELTPERSMQIQMALGADIIMAFDECVPFPCDEPRAERAMYRTLDWVDRCQVAHDRKDQALFGIVQGSTYERLRKKCAQEMIRRDFPGYAVGGVSVGEGLDLLKKVVGWTAPFLPEDKPRYLMGVGLPEDILESIERGIDMFDCVIPTRYARSATLFTFRGRIRLTNRRYRRDLFPVEPNCECYTCREFTRAYLHHLFQSDEILGHILASIHNVAFYQMMMRQAREAILEGRYMEYKEAFLKEQAKGR